MDDEPLAFGKYAFQTPCQIADHDPGYVVWLYENVEPKVVSRGLYVACQLDAEE